MKYAELVGQMASAAADLDGRSEAEVVVEIAGRDRVIVEGREIVSVGICCGDDADGRPVNEIILEVNDELMTLREATRELAKRNDALRKRNDALHTVIRDFEAERREQEDA